MYWKHPEILYFLFFLIVPILVHLFQLRRFKKEYFTNVKFLKALTIQTRKSSKIKKWLLLGCRLLLLTCIILAFAQPSFDSKETKDSNKELYIVLDNSLSMQAKGKKGELLQRAIQELLEEVPEKAFFSLLTNSESYWNTDIKSIRNTLLNTKFSGLPFQLESIVSKINAHKSRTKKDILVITDGLGLNAKQLQNSAKKEALTFIIPKLEQKNNCAIDTVFISKTVADFYEITIQLTSIEKNKNLIPVALFDQNKLIAKTAVNFEKNKKTVLFTIPKKEFHGYVSIVDNGLAFDNTYYFSILETKKVNVISIGATEKSDFLSRIYTKPEFLFQNYQLSELDYNILEKQDVIVLNELDIIPQALQTTLHSFASKGGSIILIPSDKSTLSNLNSFLKNLGNMKFMALENTEKLIAKINFNHPLFKGVFEKKVTNFQYPKTKISFSISSPNPAILSFADQADFLTYFQNQSAAIYVFSAPINGLNSNFQQSPLIVPVFYKMATNTISSRFSALVIGKNNIHFTAATLNKEDIISVKNNQEQFIPIQRIIGGKLQLDFNDYPTQAGNYQIYNKKEWIENISFNYNRSENNLAQANENQLINDQKIDSIADFFDKIQTNQTDNQIWKWFVIFAMLFLLTEMAIIRFLK